MSEKFEGFERQYCDLSANLSKKCTSATLLDGGTLRVKEMEDISTLDIDPRPPRSEPLIDRRGYNPDKLNQFKDLLDEIGFLKKKRIMDARKRQCNNITVPVKIVCMPTTISQTSEETCDTEYEAYLYNRLANADPRLNDFKMLDPETNKEDEAYTKRVIDRYRHTPSSN